MAGISFTNDAPAPFKSLALVTDSNLAIDKISSAPFRLRTLYDLVLKSKRLLICTLGCCPALTASMTISSNDFESSIKVTVSPTFAL